MWMRSRLRTWSLIRTSGGKSALRKQHYRPSVGGSGAGAGIVRLALWTASASIKKLANYFLLGKFRHSEIE